MAYLPQFFPSGWVDEYGVFGIPFTEDVSIGFVERRDGCYAYLQDDERQKLAISASKLLGDALAELANLQPSGEIKIAKPPGAQVLWIVADDNFIAIRFLLPRVQEIIRKVIGDDVLFGIPCRDDVLIWNASALLDATLSKSHEIRAEFEEDDYSLSPHVYRYSSNWPCQRVVLPE